MTKTIVKEYSRVTANGTKYNTIISVSHKNAATGTVTIQRDYADSELLTALEAAGVKNVRRVDPAVAGKIISETGYRFDSQHIESFK